MLFTRLDAECDRQATVVGRLLTTVSDDRRAVAKLFLVQRLGKALDGITLIFGDIRISYLFDKYSPSSRGLVLQTRSFGSSRGTTLAPMHWLEILRMQ